MPLFALKKKSNWVKCIRAADLPPQARHFIFKKFSAEYKKACQNHCPKPSVRRIKQLILEYRLCQCANEALIHEKSEGFFNSKHDLEATLGLCADIKPN